MIDKHLKLCIFLTDPMIRLYNKGEIKERYYNPGNLFNQVDMISFSDRDIEADKIRIIVGDAKLKIHSVGKPNIFNLFLILRRIKRLLNIIHPDLLRAYDISLRGALTCYFSKKMNVPSVISIHNNFRQQRNFDKRLILQLRRPLERYSLMNCDLLICVSETLKRYAQKYAPKRIRVIYNRVDLSRFSSLSKKSQQDHEPLRLLTVARLVDQKNQECLLKAIKDLNVKLTLIGSGPKYTRLRRMAEDLGITQKIDFIPSVPHNQIQRHYHQADLFVLATHYEGFCIPIIEAMAAGLPIVASNLEVISELTDGCALLCENTPKDFAEAIRDLIDQPQLRSQLGKRARDKALSFSSTELESKERGSCEELFSIADHNL